MIRLISFILLFSLVSCAQLRGYKVLDIEKSQIKTGYKMQQYGNLFIGAQPEAVDFIKLRQEGFVAVVNLRHHMEDGKYNEKWERNNSLLSGMSYYHVGYDPKTQELTSSMVDKIDGAIKDELSQGKVLVHCSSGNRAGMWLAANIHSNQNVPKEKALKVAKDLEVKDEALSRLEDFLK